MSTIPTIEALQQQITVLEAEIARLRPLEAAAREAYASQRVSCLHPLAGGYPHEIGSV